MYSNSLYDEHWESFFVRYRDNSLWRKIVKNMYDELSREIKISYFVKIISFVIECSL